MRLRSLRPLAFAVIPLLAFGLAGCDEVDPDLFTFDVDNVTFTFSFRADEVDGGPIERSSLNTENIVDDIQEQGFGPEEVVRAELVDGEAQIRITQAPAGVTIQELLEAVSLRLEGGSTSINVASQDDFDGQTSMLNEADLEVLSENIAPVVTAGDFGATLDVSTDPGLPAGTYRLEVRFDVAVGVTGF